MGDYFDLIARRDSCRDFDAARPVEKEKLTKCLEAARLAPSACNSQPWRFIAVTNADLLAKLRPAVQELNMNRFVNDCPALVVVVEQDASLTEKVGSRFGRQDFASVDIGLAASQFCLAATEQGLSTCILGWLNESKIRELLALDKSRRVRLVLATGYAKTDALRVKKRKTLAEMSEIIE